MRFLGALALTMGIVVSANAQQAVTGDVNANALVQSVLLVSEQHPLEFGIIDKFTGRTKTISVLGVATTNGNALSIAGPTRQGVGKIVRSGNTTITYKLVSPPTELSGATTTSSKLPIGTYVTAYNFADNTTGQTAGNSTVTDETTVSGTGTDIYVHIGATVTVSAATTASETHTAAITLSAEYN